MLMKMESSEAACVYSTAPVAGAAAEGEADGELNADAQPAGSQVGAGHRRWREEVDGGA